MSSINFGRCPTGKRTFFTEHDARKAMGRAQSRRGRVSDAHGSRRGLRIERRVYECDACDGFHLTSRSRRDVQARTYVQVEPDPSQRLDFQAVA